MDDQVKQKLQQFFSRYPLRHIKKGTFIVHAGSNPQGIYFLTQGIVRQSVTTAKGEDVVLNLFKPVSFFPLQSAVAKISNRYDFIAFTDITIQIAPAHDLASYLQSEPLVMYDLIQRLLSGLESLLQKCEKLSDHSARARLVLTLLQLGYRHGDQQPGRKEISLSLKITHRELASMCGLSRETVTNEMKKLEKLHYIKIVDRGIRIPDMQVLERMM